MAQPNDTPSQSPQPGDDYAIFGGGDVHALVGAAGLREYLDSINNGDRTLSRDELTIDAEFTAEDTVGAIRRAAQDAQYVEGMPGDEQLLLGIVPHNAVIPDFEALNEESLAELYAGRFQMKPEEVRAILHEKFDHIDTVRLSDMNPATLGTLGIVHGRDNNFIVFGSPGIET